MLPGLASPAARRLAPVAAIPASGRVIGQATFPGQERPLALPAGEALHHLHVIGPTGVGKSTLLANLACQDIAAGRGVVVIDPKGDLVADIADRIPTAQHDRVILLDPTDDDRPVGLNLLHGAHRQPELAADQVLAIFHRLYAAFWGPRTQDILHASLLTLAQHPGMTLCELPLLLSDDAFRARLVARVDDPVALGPFWAWYDQLSPAERAHAIGPVMNKLRAFLLRRRVRNVIGQAYPTFTLGDVLTAPKVLLVSLAKGQLGTEAAALVGSLVVALLWQATQQRGANRRPVMVFIDEFQDVLNLPTDLADVLAQARGFGVRLTLAHQHLGQLTSQVRTAVLTNARSKIVFQTSAEDAPALARHLGPPLTPIDLQTLAATQVYAALTINGCTSPPASAHTHPLPDPLGSAGQVRDLSRQRYGHDRARVEAAIQARHNRSRRPDHEQIGRQLRP